MSSAISERDIEQWVAHARQSPWQALLLLRHATPRFRAALPADVMREAWLRWAGTGPDRALEFLFVLSPEALVGLEGALSRLARRRRHQARFDKVLDGLPLRLEGEGGREEARRVLRRLFALFGRTQPGEALRWAAEARAPLRNALPLSLLHAVWRRQLAQDPVEAVAWLQRVPKKLHPPLTQGDLALLMGSRDAELRLAALRLVGVTEPAAGAVALPLLRLRSRPFYRNVR